MTEKEQRVLKLVPLIAAFLLGSGCRVHPVKPSDASTSGQLTAPSSGALGKLENRKPIINLGSRRNTRTEDVVKWEKRTHSDRSSQNLDHLATAYLEAGDYPRASDTFYELAHYWKLHGDPNASQVDIVLGQRYESKAGIYVEDPTDPTLAMGNYTGARLEPINGCYCGAFIDNEKSLPIATHDASGFPRPDVASFNEATGIHHAFYFIYLGYGKPFPTTWVDNLKENGAGAQFAFEPTSYDQVKDDAYLRKFAEDCKNSGIPIFLRFASEMNGDWVVYHKSPEKYIRMFRLVAKVMHEVAPNVAMVWCPFEIPVRYIERYYPGKDAVDWVGVNIYSVLYNDNDPNRNAQNRSPADALKFVYDHYSKDHPIIIGEYAAAQMSSLDHIPRQDYAIMKMNQFYESLPRLYPRVKAVHWLSMNAIKYAFPGRQLNDYSLLEDSDITKAYQKMLSDPYFLKSWKPKAMSPITYNLLKENRTVSGTLHLSAYVKTYTNLPAVTWLVDGKVADQIAMPGPYRYDLDTMSLTNGDHTIEMVASDVEGYDAVRVKHHITVKN